MSIRRMLEADLHAVERIAAACSPDAATWTRPQLLDLFAAPTRYRAWVADEGGIIVGFCYLHLAGDQAEIDNLAVSPPWRRRGIATQLLQTAWRAVSALGVSSMYLEVRQSNGAALRLYQGAGFTKTGQRIGYYANPTEDAIQLVKKQLAASSHPAESGPMKL